MNLIEAGDNLAELDAAIESLPNSPAVFALWPRQGDPYVSKTGLLRRCCGCCASAIGPRAC